MDINIVEDKNNSLLNRRELNFSVVFEGPTPTRNDVKNKLAAMLNVPLELVILQNMDNKFGKEEASGYVKIYEDAERMKTVEKEHILKRNKLPEAESATEEAA
ncbi:MAG: 30S ribosomal protein S24e [Methanosarcinaceae archaeon]|nr:30S ribosomal protein S24e [Methanosarcinaceae archaeon]